MLRIRDLPLKYRIPLIYSGLWALAWLRSSAWPRADKVMHLKPGPLVVSGFINETSGIAQGAKDIITALKAVNYPFIAHDIRPCFSQYVRGDALLPDKESGGIWLMPVNPAENIVALLAHSVDQWAHKYRIGYWAWETTMAPSMWVWVAEFFHEIWVPSPFVRDALHDAFVKARKPHLNDRLRIMLHPMEPLEAVQPNKLRFGLDPTAHETLCLFDVKSAATRKNPWAVVEAWLQAFPEPTSSARLRLKIHNIGDDPSIRDRLTSLTVNRPDISLIERRLDDEEMRIFIASFDSLISLHRSEGFGLTLAEAMAMGVSVIATGWSGNMAFMTDENGYLVPYHLVPVADPAGQYGGWLGQPDPSQKWAEPNISAAAEALRKVVFFPEERQRKMAAAHKVVDVLNAPWQGEALAALPFNAYLKR